MIDLLPSDEPNVLLTTSDKETLSSWGPQTENNKLPEPLVQQGNQDTHTLTVKHHTLGKGNGTALDRHKMTPLCHQFSLLGTPDLLQQMVLHMSSTTMANHDHCCQPHKKSTDLYTSQQLRLRLHRNVSGENGNLCYVFAPVFMVFTR